MIIQTKVETWITPCLFFEFLRKAHPQIAKYKWGRARKPIK